MSTATHTREWSDITGPAETMFPRPLQLVLVLFIAASSFVSAGILSAAMTACVVLLVVDPYMRDRRVLPPGAGYFGLMLAAGLFGSSGKMPYDVAKDVWYVGNAFLTIVCGYLIMRRMGDVIPAFRAVAWAAMLVSALHAGKFIVNPSYLSESVADLRVLTGAGHIVSALGAALALGDRRFHPGIFRRPWQARACLALCTASIVLSRSRTLWLVSLTLLAIAVMNVRFRTIVRATAVITAVAVIAMASLGGIAVSDDADAEQQTFMGKLMTSVQELRLFEYESEIDINRYWRGFESLRALQEYASGVPAEYLLGKGFGTNVELGFTMTLADEEFDRIPILHNGYLYVLVKTGALGLLCYLLFLARSFRIGARLFRSSDEAARFSGYVLAALTIVMLETTLVVSGMFNRDWLYPATLLMGMLIGHAETEDPRSREHQSAPAPALQTS